MTEQTNSSTQPDVILRTDAIEVFGVTYSHEGDWKQPIEEIIGSGHRSSDPFSRKTYFETEQDAIEYVRSGARAAAKAEMETISRQLSDRKLTFKLWLARNWIKTRKKHLGELTTHAILSNRMKAANSILENGPLIRTKKLPDLIKIPAILAPRSEVWVFDIRGFPEREVSIKVDSVAAVTFHEYDGEGFDVVARYKLTNTGGVFSYDHSSADRGKLDGPPGQAEVFLTEENAKQRLAQFAEKVSFSLGGAGPYLMLAPPAEQTIELVPSTTLPEPVTSDDIISEIIAESLADVPKAETSSEIILIEEALPDPVMGMPIEIHLEVETESPAAEPVVEMESIAEATIESSTETPAEIHLPAVIPEIPDNGLQLLTDFLMSGLTIKRPKTIDAAHSLGRIAIDEAETTNPAMSPNEDGLHNAYA